MSIMIDKIFLIFHNNFIFLLKQTGDEKVAEIRIDFSNRP